MGIRVLCFGDIHLGRVPSRIPRELGVPAWASPRAVLVEAVGYAIREQVDLVLFSGDLVDEENAFFEAFSALESALAKLAEAGIPAYGIAGNHDAAILPTLSTSLGHLKLLGKGGRWEEEVVELKSGELLRLQGWSFPARHCQQNPLGSYHSPKDGLPTIALLHCDIDAPSSSYCPVSLSDLKKHSSTVWALGHVHKPTIFQQSPPIAYLGSLAPLHPNEEGAHGAWLLEITQAKATLKHLSLAPLRYQSIPILVDKCKSKQALQAAVIDGITDWHNQHREEIEQCQAILCKVQFQGRTDIFNSVTELAEALTDEGAPIRERYYIIAAENQTKPAVTAEKIARFNDPAGLLAQKILILEKGEPLKDYEALLAKGKEEMLKISNEASFSLLEQADLEKECLRTLLINSGYELLYHILQQREGE